MKTKMTEQTIHIQYYPTRCGELIVGSYGQALCLCDWKCRRNRETVDKRIQKALNTQYERKDSPVIQEAFRQLNEYFNRQRTAFDLPLLTVGTDFQKKIWELLLTVPYGATESYLQLSQRFGDRKAIRAVSSANAANAISIFIPCHRIIGTGGKLIGYAGGVEAKKMLLDLESAERTLGL